MGEWALDSGGFSELRLHGRWTVSARQYTDEVRRWCDEIGLLAWASAQDWMCEPFILARTGLQIREHQERTLANYLELCSLAPELPWVPVLQGWHADEYFAHVEMYGRSGIHLPGLPLVGLGSVCRRQDTRMAEDLIRCLSALGIRLHGFGFKLKGLARVAKVLASADSMAWSSRARHDSPLAGCQHQKCNNCPLYAQEWYARVQRLITRASDQPVQKFLW